MFYTYKSVTPFVLFNQFLPTFVNGLYKELNLGCSVINILFCFFINEEIFVIKFILLVQHTFDTVSGEESDIPGFKWIFIGEVRTPGLWFRFSSQ